MESNRMSVHGKPRSTSARRDGGKGRQGSKSSLKKRKENTRGSAESKRLDFVKTRLNERKRRQVLVDIPKDRDGALAAMERYKEGVFEMKDAQSNGDVRADLSGKVRGLEALVDGFKGKVDELLRQFDGLKEGIEELGLQFDAVEQDYFVALDALEEEKETVAKYEGFLRNAEVENKLLHQNVPEENLQYVQAFSQARPW